MSYILGGVLIEMEVLNKNIPILAVFGTPAGSRRSNFLQESAGRLQRLREPAGMF